MTDATSMPEVPTILVIDDDPEPQRAAFRVASQAGVHFEVLHPEEVEEAHLEAADLALVDNVLTHWPGRDNARQIGLQPVNGVALASVLRERCRRLERPTGFAIHTADPEALWVTPAEPRAHVIARAYNLEWVFLKSDPGRVIQQAAALARSVHALPTRWPGDDYDQAEELACGLLSLNVEDDSSLWTQIAVHDVRACRPPLTELVERNHGLLFLRWVLQRILPYPCFLYDSHRLAARLRATHASVLKALPGGLYKWFSRVAYAGILRDFAGPRWWRAGVEAFLWELAGSAGLPPEKLREQVAQAANVTLDPASSADPIVCIDENYQPLDEACAPDQVVRVQPDDWPPFASQAWAPIDLARAQPRLKAVVAEEDRDRLEDAN